jgi:hypothetical protein
MVILGRNVSRELLRDRRGHADDAEGFTSRRLLVRTSRRDAERETRRYVNRRHLPPAA